MGQLTTQVDVQYGAGAHEVSMFNVLSGLKLGQARQATRWEEVMGIFWPQVWSMVPVVQGRMAYLNLEGNSRTGRMMVLAMLENCVAPSVTFPQGSVIMGIRGTLRLMGGRSPVDLEPWDLLSLDEGPQSPCATGLHLGLWHFPTWNVLHRMVERGLRPT